MILEEKQIENAIENGTPEQVQNIAQNAPKPIANEAKQVLDSNPRNNEVNKSKVRECLDTLQNKTADELKGMLTELNNEPNSLKRSKFDQKQLDNPNLDKLPVYELNPNTFPEERYRELSTFPNLLKERLEGAEFGDDPEKLKRNWKEALYIANADNAYFNNGVDRYKAAADVYEKRQKKIEDREKEIKEWQKKYPKKSREAMKKAIESKLSSLPKVQEEIKKRVKDLAKNSINKWGYDIGDKTIAEVTEKIYDNNKDEIEDEIEDELIEDELKRAHNSHPEHIKKFLAGMLGPRVEKAIETKPEQVLEDPKMPEEAKEEAAQVLDTKTNNDEANNQQVEKATNRLSDDFETVDDLMSYLENEYGQQTDTPVDTNNAAVNSTEQSSEGETESVGEANKEPEAGKDQDAKVLEDFIESNPEEASKEFKDTEVAEEANQILDDTDDRNNEVNDKKIGKFLEKNKGLIDWDKVKVYEPGEDPFYKVSDETDWKNNPTYHPDEGIIDDETIDEIVDSPDVVDYGLEDQNQYQEGVDPSLDETVYDKTMAETAPISDDKLEPAPEAPLADNVVQIKEDPIDEVVDEVVENDETQQETDNDFKLPNLVGGHGASLSSPGSTPVSKTDLGSNMFKVAGGSFGRMFQNLQTPSGSTPGLGSVGSTPTPVSAWNSSKSNAGGGAKVAGIKSDASRAVASHASKGISTFTSNGTYKSTALPESRKGTSISVRNVGPQYGTGTKAASSKLTLTGHKETGDLGLNKLMQLIVTASKTWKNPKDSDDLYAPYRIIIRDKSVLVNHMLLQVFAAKHPEGVQDLTNKINGVA